MNDPDLDVSYPVLITERNGEYTLHVKELALVTRGRDLALAYQEIVENKRWIYQCAKAHDTLEEVPEPRLPVIAIRYLIGHMGNGPRLVLRDGVRAAAWAHVSRKADT